MRMIEANSQRVHRYNRPGRRFFAACALALAATLCASTFGPLFRARAAGVAHAVIVEFKADPGAVWKAKMEKAGQRVSDEQLQSYRDSLTAQQNQFLEQLKGQGVSYTVVGTDLKDFAGAVAARADHRFSLVMNGIALQ